MPCVETETEEDDRRECRLKDGNACFFSLRGDVCGVVAVDSDGGGVVLPLPFAAGVAGRGTSVGVGSGKGTTSGFTSSLPFVAADSTVFESTTGVCVDGSTESPFEVVVSTAGVGVCVDGSMPDVGEAELSTTVVVDDFSVCPFVTGTSIGCESMAP